MYQKHFVKFHLRKPKSGRKQTLKFTDTFTIRFIAGIFNLKEFIDNLIDDERGFFSWNKLKENHELDK